MTPVESEPFISRAAGALDTFISRNRTLLLMAAGVLCLLTFCGYSHAKLPWEDEVLQMIIERQPTAAKVWEALKPGYIQVDPPMLHMGVHYLFQIFGEHALLARLPSILGFTLMCLSAALLVWRHAPAVYAMAAFFIPWATVMRSRAMDARPYGLVFGFTALTLLCWDGMRSDRHKTAWRIAFTISFAIMACSHFYSILFFLPLAMGEAAKWYFDRKPDWKTWVCVAAAMVPYSLFVPTLLSAARNYAKGYYYKAAWANLYDFFGLSVASIAFALVLLFLLLSLAAKGRLDIDWRKWPELPVRFRLLLIAAAGCLLIPIASYIGGVLVTGLFVPYYHYVSLFCLIIGLPLTLAALSGGSRTVGACLLLAMLAHGLFVSARGISGYRRKDAPYPPVSQLKQLTGEEQPDIVIASPHNFLPYYEAFPNDPANERLIYLYDTERALKLVGSDTADKVHHYIKPYTNARIEEFDPYTAAHKHFFLAVLGARGVQEWQFDYLFKSKPHSLTWKGKAGDFDLYQVDL